MPNLKLFSSAVIREGGNSSVPGSTSSQSLEQEQAPHLKEQHTFGSGPVNVENGAPNFVRHEESTNIELFYDLFFVANLTTFSIIHEVNSRKTLTSYIGFFCILWFTWCQTSLFDVRFIADSVLERFAKALHLGVMVGLAVVGPKFDTVDSNSEKSGKTLQTMAIVLMASRIVLGFQYALVGFHVRKYKKTKVPFSLLSLTMFSAAVIYLILSFIGKRQPKTYRAFYVIAGVEMIANIAISSKWKVVSFKHTHLVERMSLLTLYILGEGVIDVLKSIGKISKVNDLAWSSATIGIVFCACTVIYFLYMLYFDCLNHKHFGSIRQQIWAFAHFPFHAVLVLALTGMAQLVKWNEVVEAVTEVGTYWKTATTNIPTNYNVTWTTEQFENLGKSLNASIQTTFKHYPPIFTVNVDEVSEALKVITEGYKVGDSEAFVKWNEGILKVFAGVANSIFNTFEFEVPEELEESSSGTAESVLENAITTIGTVFIYFFIAAGLTLVFMGVMSLVMDTHYRWSKGPIIRFISHFLIGMSVVVIGCVGGTTQAGIYLLISPWVIPIFLIATCLIMVFHHIKWGKSDKLADAEDAHHVQ